MLTDPAGRPVFEHGLLALDLEHPALPDQGSSSFRLIVRDAYLLAELTPPAALDGRAVMALRARGELAPAERRRVLGTGQWELLELARRTGLTARELQHLDPAIRGAMLADLRGQEAEQARRQLESFREQITG